MKGLHQTKLSGEKQELVRKKHELMVPKGTEILDEQENLKLYLTQIKRPQQPTKAH
jgi:hypothetical protein